MHKHCSINCIAIGVASTMLSSSIKYPHSFHFVSRCTIHWQIQFGIFNGAHVTSFFFRHFAMTFFDKRRSRCEQECVSVKRVVRHSNRCRTESWTLFAHTEREIFYPHRAMAVRFIRKIVRILFNKTVRKNSQFISLLPQHAIHLNSGHAQFELNLCFSVFGFGFARKFAFGRTLRAHIVSNFAWTTEMANEYSQMCE